MKVIDTRRSIREYSDKLVEDKEILKILKAAMQAPSARNQQPWEYLIIRDQEKKEKIANSVPAMRMASGANFLIIFLTRKDKLTSPLYYLEDMGSTVTYAMLEARAQGIGSVWCGVAPNPERMEIVRDVFDIKDEKYEPFALVCFGYPKDENAFVKAKRYDKKKVHFEVL